MINKIMSDSVFYVKTPQKFIYKVTDFRQLDSNELCLYFSMELVLGWDYVQPDLCDVQGYVGAHHFVENVQDESFMVYLLSESIEDVLNSYGWTYISESEFNRFYSHYLVDREEC